MNPVTAVHTRRPGQGAARLTTFTAVAAVFAAIGLTAAESAFGSADAAAAAAIEAAGHTPCLDQLSPLSHP